MKKLITILALALLLIGSAGAAFDPWRTFVGQDLAPTYTYDSTLHGAPRYADDAYMGFGDGSGSSWSAVPDLKAGFDATTDSRFEVTMASGGVYVDVTDINLYSDDPTNDTLTVSLTTLFTGPRTVQTDVTGTTNTGYQISMQEIDNADAVSGSEAYILNDHALNESANSYTVWANELTDDVPRAIVVDPAASFTGTVTINGTDMNDDFVSETLTFSSDAAQTTAAAYKDLTYINTSVRTGGSDTTMDVGLGARLGLNTKLTDTAQVQSVSVANVLESTAATVTVSATTLSLNTVDPHTANDGAKDVKVYMMV